MTKIKKIIVIEKTRPGTYSLIAINNTNFLTEDFDMLGSRLCLLFGLLEMPFVIHTLCSYIMAKKKRI